jgi:hypothetical protein
MRAYATIAILLSCPAGSASAEEACPPVQRVSVDLHAWAKALRRARTPAALDQGLAAIGLPTSRAGDGAEVFSCEKKQLFKLHVDLFAAKLRDDGEAQVVQVLAALCPEEAGSWQLQRGAAFVPAGKDTWCRVETPFLNRSGSDWGPQLCNPARFAFERLTSDKHVVLKLTDEQEWCGGAGVDRGGQTQVGWWELQGLRFAPLLSVTTDRAYYHSPTPPVESLTTKVKLTGAGFPRVIKLVEQVTCDDPDDENELAQEEFKRCKARKTRKTCVYRDGSYACMTGK